jgi:hypothetical protein
MMGLYRVTLASGYSEDICAEEFFHDISSPDSSLVFTDESDAVVAVFRGGRWDWAARVGECVQTEVKPVASPRSASDPTRSIRWEYDCLKNDGISSTAQCALLNKRGAEGWEAFHVEQSAVWLKRRAT